MAGPRGEDVLGALAERPGGRELLELSEHGGEVSLVGGAVRDLLLVRTPRELDVVVAADAQSFAAELASRLGASVTANERFATALVQWQDGRIDVAMRRAESYSAPGALPEVRPGSLEEDLARRDFTVNAIAVALAGPDRGELRAPAHALADLQARQLRVLHEQSFLDDPTRLLRLARYATRLGFAPEPRTSQLAAQALAAGALAGVSRARVGAELRLALGEPDAPATLAALADAGLLGELHPRLAFDGALAFAALELLAYSPPPPPPTTTGEGERGAAVLLAVLAASLAPEPEAYALLSELEFPAQQRDRALRAASAREAMAERLALARSRSEIHGAVAGADAVAVALAGAWGARAGGSLSRARAGAREWLEELGGVGLLISGEDLLAAGVPQGPEIRLRLQAALARKLDGELDSEGREAELQAALEAQP